MPQLLHRDTTLALEFTGTDDGFEVLYGGKPIGALHMRRHPLEGPPALQDNDRADLASAESLGGRWVFETRDVNGEIHIRDSAAGERIGSYQPRAAPGKSMGELALQSGERYQWQLIEADPNQVLALVREDGHSLLRLESKNNLESGRIDLEDPAAVSLNGFELLLLFSLYLYLRPVPGVKAAPPSR